MEIRCLLPVLLLTAGFGCKSTSPVAGPSPKAELDRDTFNRAANGLNLPLFWHTDDDGQIAPEEVAVLWGFSSPRKAWVAEGRWTPQFEAALAAIRAWSPTPPDARRALLTEELAQGRPTLLRTDLRSESAEVRKMVALILETATLVEQIYARQNGVHGWASRIPQDDPLSQRVFFRNQGPWCEAPKTQKEKACTALAPTPPKISGLYPRALQEKDPDFCKSLASAPDGAKLMHHFHTVEQREGKLVAVPYHEAFVEEMTQVAQKLDQAAALLGPDEAAFANYLRASAKAFRDGSWEKADEAWADMNASNSRWYLRVGPDETYFEPCSRKAGFHVTFARIDQSSKAWQQKLDPVKTKMEAALAALAGPPYAARTVAFDLPDFIHILVNAGDARRSLGATVGQSLPNWGPVANEGRGRTVAMMNVNSDPDSVAASVRQARSILCEATYAAYDPDPDALTMSTVLHEAAHNLGPAHEYRVDGKTDDEAFGGPLASVLEELKAETASYYFADWLAKEKIIDEAAARKAHVRDLLWGFGHIARGLDDPDGKPKTYSYVAAIQDGYWLEKGVATWKPNDKAASGDTGCLELDLEKMPTVIEALMKEVAGIKARGDKGSAEALVQRHVKNPSHNLFGIVQERWRREPEASLVYAVELE